MKKNKDVSVKIELPECNKVGFMWGIIEKEILKQPSLNLINLRKLINKTLKERLRSEKFKKEVV